MVKLPSTSHYISKESLFQEKVERFWQLESSGIYEQEKDMSVDDRRVLALWDEKVSFSGGHYVLPIPFKDSTLKLPDNRQMAEKRLSSLGRKLDKNRDLHQKYVDGMSNLLEQGYAVPVPEQDIHRSDGKVWYLPHHPVINPNKEKIRIIFDCAAEYGGISLNSKVRQGPDLTNKLVGVLTRFCLHPIAVMVDIQTMFHQVQVTQEDQDTLRFLWWPEGNLSKLPMSYKMTVHLFGGTWSPSCCTYALRRVAKDNAGSCSPATLETITQNFYVDDCLKSMPTVSEAINLVSELKMLAAEGGFNLTKWTSNSPDVISKVPYSDRSKKAQEHVLDTLTEDRALGVCWCVQEDQLSFQVQGMDQPLTKRGVLSMLSSVYNPLGLASPFVLRARRIVQNLCRTKIGWDEPIPEVERENGTSGLVVYRIWTRSACHDVFNPSQVYTRSFTTLRMPRKSPMKSCHTSEWSLLMAVQVAPLLWQNPDSPLSGNLPCLGWNCRRLPWQRDKTCCCARS